MLYEDTFMIHAIMQLNLEEDAINSIATMKEIALRDACSIYYTQHPPV